MDLLDLAPTNEPVLIQLRHPVTGKPLYLQKKVERDGVEVEEDDLDQPIGVFVVGVDSEEFAARERWIIQQRMKRAEAIAKGQKIDQFEDFREEAINTIVACIKGFKNIIVDGKELQFTAENARMLLNRLKFVKELLDREIMNRANFIKASRTNS